MDKHITILGALHIAFGALGVLIALITFFAVAGGGWLSGDMDSMMISTGIATGVAFFILVFSVPGLIGGFGLLRKQSWARILVLVISFLDLLNIPFGTILGIYSIWVLMKDETQQLFAAA